MGRGIGSKGKREGGGPDWLNPTPTEGDGGGMRARAKRPSMEFVTLATLSPWAGASMACQQTNATPSPSEVAAAARLRS